MTEYGAALTSAVDGVIMNRSALASLAFAPFLLAFAPPFPAPLGPAAEGKILCLTPDVERRVCEEMTRYTIADDGQIDSFNISLLNEQPVILLEAAAPARLKDGMVCDASRREHAENSRIIVEEGARSPIDIQALHKLGVAMAMQMQGHDLCMEFVQDRDSLIVKYIFDGRQSNLPDAPAIWVAPEDGFRVAP